MFFLVWLSLRYDTTCSRGWGRSTAPWRAPGPQGQCTSAHVTMNYGFSPRPARGWMCVTQLEAGKTGQGFLLPRSQLTPPRWAVIPPRVLQHSPWEAGWGRGEARPVPHPRKCSGAASLDGAVVTTPCPRCRGGTCTSLQPFLCQLPDWQGQESTQKRQGGGSSWEHRIQVPPPQPLHIPLSHGTSLTRYQCKDKTVQNFKTAASWC